MRELIYINSRKKGRVVIGWIIFAKFIEKSRKNTRCDKLIHINSRKKIFWKYLSEKSVVKFIDKSQKHKIRELIDINNRKKEELSLVDYLLRSLHINFLNNIGFFVEGIFETDSTCFQSHQSFHLFLRGVVYMCFMKKGLFIYVFL